MNATAMISYDAAHEHLGPKYEAALDCMWENNGFGDEISFSEFLRAWTEYVNDSARFAAQNNL